MTDFLFAQIEAEQGSFGSVLDAGTGEHSLAWLAALPTERWTAVTATASYAEGLRGQVRPRAQDRIVVGNWGDDDFLRGEAFDVVIAHHLLVAIEATAPYFQDLLFHRLRRHVKRRLYVIEQEPLPAQLAGDAQLVVDIARLRDACTLLAGERPYREYPLGWTVDSLEAAGFRIVKKGVMPVIRPPADQAAQLAAAARHAANIADAALRAALEARIAELRERSRAVTAEAGAHYLVVAEPRQQT